MNILLEKEVSKPIILQGFPGFGLIGTIVTEYLIEHLDAEKIGSIQITQSSPVLAIQNGILIEPVGIYYVKKYNLIIIHTVQNLQGLEWEYAETIKKLVTRFFAWELISIEGVVDQSTNEKPSIYFYTNTQSIQNSLESCGLSPLQNGIIMGTGAALLSEKLDCRVSAFFTTTHSQLPDSRAAAVVITALDSYLKFNVPTKPLLAKAQEFEQKYTSLLENVKTSKNEISKKNLSYVG